MQFLKDSWRIWFAFAVGLYCWAVLRSADLQVGSGVKPQGEQLHLSCWRAKDATNHH